MTGMKGLNSFVSWIIREGAIRYPNISKHELEIVSFCVGPMENKECWILQSYLFLWACFRYNFLLEFQFTSCGPKTYTTNTELHQWCVYKDSPSPLQQNVRARLRNMFRKHPPNWSNKWRTLSPGAFFQATILHKNKWNLDHPSSRFQCCQNVAFLRLRDVYHCFGGEGG